MCSIALLFLQWKKKVLVFTGAALEDDNTMVFALELKRGGEARRVGANDNEAKAKDGPEPQGSGGEM